MSIISVEVSSSFVDKIIYSDTREMLDVIFNNGHVYRYMAIPFEEFEALRQASSVGSYFVHHIKPTYTSIKLTESDLAETEPVLLPAHSTEASKTVTLSLDLARQIHRDLLDFKNSQIKATTEALDRLPWTFASEGIREAVEKERERLKDTIALFGDALALVEDSLEDEE